MNAATRTLLASCIALVGLAAIAPASAQSVYSWKDDKGVTHYSDAPPPKGAVTKREVKAPTPTIPAPVTAKVEPADAKAAKAKAEEQAAAAKANADQLAAARAANCKTAQGNLAMLSSATPVGVDNNGDGQIDTEYSPEQRAQQTQNMQAAVAANCSQ